MKWLVIGDLHGRYEVAEAALKEGFPTIFVGDYVDSYTRSIEDQLKTLDVVITAVREDKAIALMGNHERSYLFPGERCSGYKPALAMHLVHMKDVLLKELLPYTRQEGFLITHAGVNLHVLERMNMTLEEYLEAGEFNHIGYARGGNAPLGGLYWNDFRYEFVPIPGVQQIFGHTRGYDIRSFDQKNWCIDMLESAVDCKGLLIENGVAEIYPF